ncbi:polypeptide N-acetylgalactosaminyltransferase 8 [Zeugodacus cucurbitae]|uniref:polypeptide N-acetylgalactosaminyltransferase 8 n=1 Tax=Zeugodacus cucurbitae TaxID=28588 RepID=UPI0023D906F4|nr:polypeptide N-acetylgalactosaminyltransferase 8 [Zeugodacus cucurbitae]
MYITLSGLHLRLRRKRTLLEIILICIIFIAIHQLYTHRKRVEETQLKKDNEELEECRDWHDYAAITRDAEREGLGEQGRPAVLPSGHNKEAAAASWHTYGFNALLSEQISAERAVPDFRHLRCRSLTYRKVLPTTSIIIVHHDEHPTVVQRTLHSLWNRTPHELLHEIILVDDCSTAPRFETPFERQLLAKFGTKLKILKLTTHEGLIRARVAGARMATGEAFVFLDAHVEAAHNWLPPLLQPIVDDPQTSTTPMIDIIDYGTFEYIEGAPARGGFNWNFVYVELPLLAEEQASLPTPHNNPVMNGGLFAIGARFFWHLGAYDEGLEVWGAEQFELSFKIWMCGGRLLEVPCSRFGHLYRDEKFEVKYTNGTQNYQEKNFKRVASVWLDEYQDVLYKHNPELRKLDVGDMSARRALREQLHCKSFKWFLDTIAPDLMQMYPPVVPPDFAFGAIQSFAAPHLCLDTLQLPAKQPMGDLRSCSSNLKQPVASQNWQLTFHRDLQTANNNCLELQSREPNASVWLWPCHYEGGNQFWFYDQQTQLLMQGEPWSERRCLEANVTTRRAYMNICDSGNVNMKWNFGFVNHTLMANFFKDLKADDAMR